MTATDCAKCKYLCSAHDYDGYEMQVCIKDPAIKTVDSELMSVSTPSHMPCEGIKPYWCPYKDDGIDNELEGDSEITKEEVVAVKELGEKIGFMKVMWLAAALRSRAYLKRFNTTEENDNPNDVVIPLTLSQCKRKQQQQALYDLSRAFSRVINMLDM